VAARLGDPADAYSRLVGAGLQGFVLSTCLRVEVAVPGSADELDLALQALGVDGSAGSRLAAEEAVRHLFRVAAGLESPISGEREILAQFRESMQEAVRQEAATGMLVSLLESAVAAGRRAREILPGSPHRSLAAVAAQMAGAADRVAVFGAGVMGRATVEALALLPAPPEITVFVRRPDEIEIGGATVAPFERAVEALAGFPAVISATSASSRIVDLVDVEGAVARRHDPLVLVDLAMPPDFDPPTSPAIRYYDIDSLAGQARRSAHDHAADEMVAGAARDAFAKSTGHDLVAPVIHGMFRTADDAVEEVVDRFAGRLAQPEDREVLVATARAVARKILHQPVSFLGGGGHREETIDAVAAAFGIDRG
jgi:glutamyl-tRNA reductase